MYLQRKRPKVTKFRNIYQTFVLYASEVIDVMA